MVFKLFIMTCQTSVNLLDNIYIIFLIFALSQHHPWGHECSECFPTQSLIAHVYLYIYNNLVNDNHEGCLTDFGLSQVLEESGFTTGAVGDQLMDGMRADHVFP